MRAVVLAVAAAGLLNLASCSPKPPADDAHLPTSQADAANPAADAPDKGAGVAEVTPGAVTAEPLSEAAAVAVEPAATSGPATEAPTEAPTETAPRDAQEAAEDAARKIFDATRGAAALIKEAGQDAVQSVRDATAPKEAE